MDRNVSSRAFANMAIPQPMEYFVLPSTHFVPNNPLPVLVYRQVLPTPVHEVTTTPFLEKNKWERKGLWPGTTVHHFHPNTHECYGKMLLIPWWSLLSLKRRPAVVKGETVMHLGRGQSDDPQAGRQVTLKVGDVLVMPAGVSHMNVSSTYSPYEFVAPPDWTCRQ